MHNKFIVVDDDEVETASFNFTAAAERKNAENVLVLRGDSSFARQYEAEWRRLWNEPEPMRRDIEPIRIVLAISSGAARTCQWKGQGNPPLS